MKLEVRHGSLCAGPSMLLVRYPEGDCDSIPWPMTVPGHRVNLARALYDEYEMGNLKVRTVQLPNGDDFNIDEELIDEPVRAEDDRPTVEIILEAYKALSPEHQKQVYEAIKRL